MLQSLEREIINSNADTAVQPSSEEDVEGNRRSSINVKQYLRTLQVCQSLDIL